MQCEIRHHSKSDMVHTSIYHSLGIIPIPVSDTFVFVTYKQDKQNFAKP